MKTGIQLLFFVGIMMTIGAFIFIGYAFYLGRQEYREIRTCTQQEMARGASLSQARRNCYPAYSR